MTTKQAKSLQFGDRVQKQGETARFVEVNLPLVTVVRDNGERAGWIIIECSPA